MPGGGRSVDGCGRQSWCVMRVGGVGRGGRSRAGLWGSVACGGGACVLLPVSYYEEVMRVKTAWGLRRESLGRGNGALAAGYPRLRWLGCPAAPWGQRLPTSVGRETTACFSVTEVLRFRPQELTRRGHCGPGRPREMIMKRKWGARIGLAVGTFLQPGGGRCLGLLPLPCARGAVVGGGVVPPQTSVFARCHGHRSPSGAGMKRLVASPPLHNRPPGAAWPVAPAVGGGGALGAVRGPSALLVARTARIMQQGATRARTARAGRAAPAGVGDRGGTGGGQGFAAGGWRVAGARTAHRQAPPPSSREALLQGFWGRGGEAKATRGHDTWCIGREV